MEIKELISELRKYPSDALVYISDNDGIYSFLLDIEEESIGIILSDNKMENKEPYISKEIINWLESVPFHLNAYIRQLDYPSNELTNVYYIKWNNSIVLTTY